MLCNYYNYTIVTKCIKFYCQYVNFTVFHKNILFKKINAILYVTYIFLITYHYIIILYNTLSFCCFSPSLAKMKKVPRIVPATKQPHSKYLLKKLTTLNKKKKKAAL